MWDKIAKKLEASFDYFKSNQIGAAVKAVKDDKIIYENYLGLANYEYSIPISKETVFPILSLTKQFTAMIIMILQKDGLLEYDDRVKEYLDDFPPYAEEITIRNLLHQVTGLLDPYSYYEEKDINSYNINSKDIFKLLQEQEALRFSVGEKFDYCNSNYVLLAMIAEKISNKSFREILQERIFRPLNMIDSDLYDSRYIIKNRAYGYIRDRNGLYTVDNQWLSYGDGGIISTIEDMDLWHRGLLDESLISNKALEIAFTSGITNEGERTNYGFGWVVREVNGSKIIRHAGGDTGFGSIVMGIPEKKFHIIMLSNTHDSWKDFAKIVNDIEDMIFSE